MNRDRPFVVAAIPAYDEEKTIARVVLQAQRFVDRVVVCDDGSRDLTAEIAERLGAEVIRHERNLGKGAAFKSLFGKALELDADVVVTLDADGQHDPLEIPHLVKPILSGDADITVGSRFLAGNNEMPLYRRFGSKMLNGLVNMRARGKEKVSDTQSGFRAYNRKALDEIDIATEGIGVDSEILMKAYGNDVRIKEVPVSCRFKGVDGSTYTPLRHGVSVVMSILRLVMEKKPLLFLGVPSAVSLLVGVLFWLWMLQIFAIEHRIVTNIALASMAFMMIGFFSISMAITLHAIPRLRRKTNNSSDT